MQHPHSEGGQLRLLGVPIARFRRARPLACYWHGGRLIVHNYYTGEQAPLPPLAADLLTYCESWRTAAEIRRRFHAYQAGAIDALLALLASRTLLERVAGRPPGAGAFDGWADWMPAGAFFHFSTKDLQYGDAAAMRQKLVRKSKRDPAPAPLKRYPAARRTALPAPKDGFELASVLKARRTWRQFRARAAVPLQDVATLLGMTWGVQAWAHGVVGPVALKTSPSGGARHPIEAYLLARRVEGLAPGWYHYDPDAHALHALASARVTTAAAYLPRQHAYHSAPAVFVMTAVFAREQWVYRNPRAYRVVLLDAGHLGQTFCLVATALGLAPFCTAALADSRIERDLGLDGVSESVLYACGVGVRPPGVDWAPWPDGREKPRVTPPTAARRRTRGRS